MILIPHLTLNDKNKLFFVFFIKLMTSNLTLNYLRLILIDPYCYIDNRSYRSSPRQTFTHPCHRSSWKTEVDQNDDRGNKNNERGIPIYFTTLYYCDRGTEDPGQGDRDMRIRWDMKVCSQIPQTLYSPRKNTFPRHKTNTPPPPPL